jgi:hypothetical protein
VIGFSYGAIGIREDFPTIRMDRGDHERVLRLTSETETDAVGNRVQKRVRATVDLQAADLDEAIELGIGMAEEAMDIASFVTGAASGSVEPWVAYETTPNLSERPFRQYLRPENGLPESVTRPVAIEEFRRIYTAKTKLVGQQRWLALSNAMFWFDRACEETKPVHRYVAMWLALESLEAPLAKVFQSKPETGKCNACGAGYKRQSAVGIRDLFQRVENKTSFSFREARDLRVAIMHATRTLYHVNEQARAYLPHLRVVFEHGIRTLLDIGDQAGSSHSTLLPVRIPVFMTIEAVLMGQAASSMGLNGEEPHYVIRAFPALPAVQPGPLGTQKLSINPIPMISVPQVINAMEYAGELSVKRIWIDGDEVNRIE